MEGNTRKLVLIVEDDPSTASLMKAALQDDGYNVLGPAPSVDAALAIMDQSAPDAAVLDYRLGRATSEPLLPTLQARDVRVCVLTGSSLDELPSNFLALPILRKPIGPRELVAQVARLLE